MNGFFPNAFDAFLRSSLLLTLAAMVVWAVLCLMRPKAPRTHRAAWGSVLLCGILIIQMSLEIPWYEAEAVVWQDAADASHQLPDLNGLAHKPTGDHAAAPPPGGFAARAAPIHTRLDWRAVLVGLWVAGMIGTAGIAGVSYCLLLVSMRRATTADPTWQRQWRRLLRSERIRIDIPLLIHAHLGPMLCRLPRGYVVVVPESPWDEFSSQERLAILRHELAHYQRRDVWTSLIARLLAVPHWYNPFAWWAVRKFDEGGEWACDDRLLADPRQVPAFARALLAMIEPESNRVCTTGARGSSLSVRLRRLLSFQTQEDSLMKRSLLCGVLIVLVTCGVFRVQLAARAQEEADHAAVERQVEDRITDFAGRLQGEGIVDEFKSALATPAGKIVLRDYASHFDERMRNEAHREALPSYLDERFVKNEHGYHLRDNQAAYREQLIDASETFNEDVAKIARALRDLSTEVGGTSEADRLLVRFMNHDASATMLYVGELRARLRPDETFVQRHLGELFVADENGSYIIRAGRRPEAEDHLRRAHQAHKALKPIRQELQDWAREFVVKDELHKQVQQAFTEPLFASFVATELIGDGDAGVAQRLEEFFEHLGHLAVDTADGLEIVEDEPRREIGEVLERYSHTVRASKKLAGPLKAFAAKLEGTDELSKGWRQVLSSDLAIVWLAREYPLSEEPGEIIREMLGEVLEERNNGKLYVIDERAEGITEHIRGMLREYRSVRRRARVIDELARQIDDAELHKALLSTGGKLVVLHSIQNSLRRAQFDGLTMWINEHFVETDGGLALRDDGENMVREFLAQVADVNEELKNNDF